MRALCPDDLDGRRRPATCRPGCSRPRRTGGRRWVDMPLCADDIDDDRRSPTSRPSRLAWWSRPGSTDDQRRSDVVDRRARRSVAPALGPALIISLTPARTVLGVGHSPSAPIRPRSTPPLPGADGPPTTGDDPAVWLPALLGAARGRRGPPPRICPGATRRPTSARWRFEDPLEPPIADAHPLTRGGDLPWRRSPAPTHAHVYGGVPRDIGPRPSTSARAPRSPGSASLVSGRLPPRQRRALAPPWSAHPAHRRRDRRRLWPGHPAPVTARPYGSRRCNAGRAAPAT